MLVVRLCTGHDEDHGLGDRYGVISEPLVVAAQQGDVDRIFNAVRPVVYQCQQRAAQAVHGVVVDFETSRVLSVAYLQRDPGTIGDPARDITHPAKYL